MDNRWSALVCHSNLAGLLATSVVVIGVSAKGANRSLVVTEGQHSLPYRKAVLRSSPLSRGSWFPRSVATVSQSLFLRRLRAAWVATAVFTVTAVSYVVRFYSPFGGRTDAWRLFLGLCMRSPLADVGEKGVSTFVEDWRGSTSGDEHHDPHGYTMVLASFARYFITFGFLRLSVVVPAGIAGARVLARGKDSARANLPLSPL